VIVRDVIVELDFTRRPGTTSLRSEIEDVYFLGSLEIKKREKKRIRRVIVAMVPLLRRDEEKSIN